MKLLLLDEFRLGVLEGDTVHDVTAAVQDLPHTGPHDLINALIARFAERRAALTEAVRRGKGVPLTQVRIRPPLPRRRRPRRRPSSPSC